MIRPIDLQNTFLAAQAAPAGPRSEQGQRADAQAAAAALAAQRRHREQEVAPTYQVLGNRIGSKESDSESAGSKSGRRQARKPRSEFEALLDDAAGSPEEPRHSIDFTA